MRTYFLDSYLPPEGCDASFKHSNTVVEMARTSPWLFWLLAIFEAVVAVLMTSPLR